MIEGLLAALMGFFAPIPWAILVIHILVLKNKWNFAATKVITGLAVIFGWLVISYWLFGNYQILFLNQFEGVFAKLAGFVVLAVALTIEIFTTRALGTRRIFGSSELVQTKKDRLITDGIYKYARHPRYTEHPFWFLGLGLLFGYPALILFSLYLFLAFAITAYYEEQELIKRYGEEYVIYKKKTPNFFIST